MLCLLLHHTKFATCNLYNNILVKSINILIQHNLILFIYYVERHQIIQEAISEAKLSQQMKDAALNVKDSNSPVMTSSRLLLKGFKKASPQAVKQGKARLLIEDIVYRAERKLSELKRKKDVKSNIQTKAEDLAEELFHKPGSFLKANELAQIYEECKCRYRRKKRSCNQVSVYTFRTIDGTCNNLRKPLQGAAQTPFRRLIPAHYEDGISTPRGRLQAVSTRNKSGSYIFRSGPFDPPLPSARLISKSVVRDRPGNESPFSHVVMQWGQFLDHDMDLGPEMEVECESCEITENCEPIRIPKNDPVFSGGRGSTEDGQCLSFRRSIPACTCLKDGSHTARDQLNDLTSYIDGSQIYGSNLKNASSLRTFKNGLLKIGEGNNLPSRKNEESEESFFAGDIRVNEQIGLTSMHTLWLREHNRIAKQFKKINKHWSDEQIYQEARKLVGAMLQKITYTDYLPKVMGQANFDMLVQSYKGYSLTTDASVPNSFATAAYRYGHSLVRPVFSRFLDDRYENGVNNPIGLRAAFFNRTAFLETNLASIFRGLITQSSLRMDEFVNSVLTTQLFQGSKSHSGMDLASLNIQRQRDHGLAPYVVWRNFCQRKFPSLPMGDIKNSVTFVRFLQAYGVIDNVDLWVGGLSEERLPNSLLGPTFACIFGLTFGNARHGDRFYYERPGVFTPAQRKEINKAMLSRVVCDNTAIKTIQSDVFLNNQSRVNCATLSRVNLKKWKEPICYLRIALKKKNRMRVMALYRASGVRHARSVRVYQNQPGCVQVRCPSKSIKELIDVYPINWRNYYCRAVANYKLPQDISSLRSRYRGAFFSDSFIDAGSGIYSSLKKCKTGPENAITYKCPFGEETNIENNNADDELDKYFDQHHEKQDDNLANQVSNDNDLVTELDNTDDDEEDCSSPSSTTCNLPKDYVEEEINKLKAAEFSKESPLHDAHKEMKEVTFDNKIANDHDLLKQLQNTLNKINK